MPAPRAGGDSMPRGGDSTAVVFCGRSRNQDLVGRCQEDERDPRWDQLDRHTVAPRESVQDPMTAAATRAPPVRSHPAQARVVGRRGGRGRTLTRPDRGAGGVNSARRSSVGRTHAGHRAWCRPAAPAASRSPRKPSCSRSSRSGGRTMGRIGPRTPRIRRPANGTTRSLDPRAVAATAGW
jgi:hypothetical protein